MGPLGIGRNTPVRNRRALSCEGLFGRYCFAGRKGERSQLWGYEAAMIAQGAAAGQCEVQIAQISDSFGLGLYRQQSFIV